MVIYAIPGLATTHKLFQFTNVRNCELKTLEWPQPVKGENMNMYARRFIDQIDQTKSFSLLGVSFGGMLCSELSHLVNAEHVFLISSCKIRNEIPWHIRAMKYLAVYKLLSESMLRKIACHSRQMIGFEKKYQKEFNEMIYSMPPNYMKNSINMIVNWDNKKMPKHSIHIHGTSDRLLFFSCVKADHAIENGSHAMIVNNAEEINKLLGSYF